MRLREGQRVRAVDLAGGQVGDLFAFAAADPDEYASASHTRVGIAKLFPLPGDLVLTNRRRPILSVIEDTSPGRHDMLYAACDPARYAGLGAPAAHRSCAGNLGEALHGEGLSLSTVPQPLNIFMDVRPNPDGTIVSAPGLRPRPGTTSRSRLPRTASSCCPAARWTSCRSAPAGSPPWSYRSTNDRDRAEGPVPVHGADPGGRGDRAPALLAEPDARASSTPTSARRPSPSGSAPPLRPDDYITSTHRGHGHCWPRAATSTP